MKFGPEPTAGLLCYCGRYQFHHGGLKGRPMNAVYTYSGLIVSVVERHCTLNLCKNERTGK